MHSLLHLKREAALSYSIIIYPLEVQIIMDEILGALGATISLLDSSYNLLNTGQEEWQMPPDLQVSFQQLPGLEKSTSALKATLEPLASHVD